MEPKTAKTELSPEIAARRAAMAVLAQARRDELEAGLRAVDANIVCADIRPVETGLVMVRGRIGGDGAPFNLGEATVTRSAVQLSSGEIGHAYLLGRDKDRARLAALADAMWQAEAYRDAVERHVLTPVQQRCDAERAQEAARTAATRVDFFTLVRGED